MIITKNTLKTELHLFVFLVALVFSGPSEKPISVLLDKRSTKKTKEEHKKKTKTSKNSSIL